jgi:hypothetical protein
MNRKRITRAVASLILATFAPGVLAVDPTPAAPPAAAPARHWSWQPVGHFDSPTVKRASWVRSPLDAFVLARLEQAGLAPSPDADRVTFIRRASLDAWGLIPTPAEVKAFVEDRSPDAYERLVDRLLASPRFGERQARHWLDLARYADSTGFQNDATRPNMWRYRDYVIAAFNADKPYDRFVREQLAGDELAPEDPDSLIATGFLLNYPDNYNSRDLIQRKYQITTDMLDTTGKVFLGLTLECARCHNHKTDKLTQRDYFSLQAFFAGTAVNEKIPAPQGAQELAFEKSQAAYRAAIAEITAKQKAILDVYREAGRKYHKERYLIDAQASLFKPEKDWTPLDRWVNHRYANVSNDYDIEVYLKLVAEDRNHPQHTLAAVADYAELERLNGERKKFDGQKPQSGSRFISAATEISRTELPPTFIRFAGIHERPTDEVQPAFPVALTDEKPVIVPTAKSSGRRTALASWIASPQNPLTARVFVNRVWSWYFGTGLVRTVSDFGKAGEKPSHPELLDALAERFVQGGWSVKKLHREILLSSAYRQASIERADARKVDPQNRLLALFPRKRLDAEEIRDSLLLASGLLNETVGGPAVFPPLPATVSPGENRFDRNPLWTVSRDHADWTRRSLYVFTRRSVPYSLLEVFDAPNANIVHSKRDVTTTPLQALTLFNSEIVFGWSQALAGRVITLAGKDEAADISLLYRLLFSRPPTPAELADLRAFLEAQQEVIRNKGPAADGKYAVSLPTGVKPGDGRDPIRLAAFVDLVHTVANSNEFSYRF